MQRYPPDYVVLRAADTGCGMDEATLARIFERYFTTRAAGISELLVKPYRKSDLARALGARTRDARAR